VSSSTCLEFGSRLKKVNIVLEYPKILVVCLDIDSNKEDNKREFKDNNTSTKP